MRKLASLLVQVKWGKAYQASTELRDTYKEPEYALILEGLNTSILHETLYEPQGSQKIPFADEEIIIESASSFERDSDLDEEAIEGQINTLTLEEETLENSSLISDVLSENDEEVEKHLQKIRHDIEIAWSFNNERLYSLAISQMDTILKTYPLEKVTGILAEERYAELKNKVPFLGFSNTTVDPEIN